MTKKPRPIISDFSDRIGTVDADIVNRRFCIKMLLAFDEETEKLIVGDAVMRTAMIIALLVFAMAGFAALVTSYR